MPKKKYIIVLTDKERQQLKKTIRCGTSPAKANLRANIILLLDESTGKYMSVNEIADALNTTSTTVMNVKKAYCEKGINNAITRKKRSKPPVEAKITDEVKTKIIALSCSEPPAGFSRWTLRLLADKSVELGIINQISYVSVGRVLKKLKPHLRKYRCISKNGITAFVANMEDVLDIYQRSYDPAIP